MIKKLDEGLHKVSNFCVWISGVTLFLIAAFIFIDVLGRYVFSHPITGSQEIVELAIVCVLYLGLPYSTYCRSHVRVDALITHFPYKARMITLGVVTLLCVLVSGPIAVQLFRQGLNVVSRGTASAILKIRHWPFYFVASFGNLLLTLEFISDGVRLLLKAGHPEDDPEAEMIMPPAALTENEKDADDRKEAERE